MTYESFNTIWLSDVHLGSRDCRIGLFLDFLRSTHCETLYLVGDIIDIGSLRRSFYWPRDAYRSAAAAAQGARKGTRVIYMPGNHDEDLRALVGVRVRQHRGPPTSRARDRRRPKAARAARRRVRRA